MIQPAQANAPAPLRLCAPAPAAGSTTVGTEPLRCVGEPASASPNSFAEPQRSAGSFCSAVRIAASTAGRYASAAWDGARGGCSVSTFATIACELGPVNGGSPASIS